MDSKIYHLLGRPPLDIQVPNLEKQRILITGAQGFLGRKVAGMATYQGAEVLSTDIGNCDVTNIIDVDNVFDDFKPQCVIHLAAHKYATSAEDKPAEVTELNVIGTQNIVRVCKGYGTHLVLASTCKAADPCTVYGASKLIAERIVLNYSFGVVFRLVNIVGSTGSVVDIWNGLGHNDPLPVTPGERYWIAPDEAARYLLACVNMRLGLYGPDTTKLTRSPVGKLAARYDGARYVKLLPHRRGDRPSERLLGEYDNSTQVDNCMMEIKGPW